MAQLRPLPDSVREIMEGLPRIFQPARAQGARATIQFNFSGPEPGEWILQVTEGKCQVRKGRASSPNAVIDSPSDVWLKISRRELDAATAFISGQFTFRGDLEVLKQLQGWFGH